MATTRTKKAAAIHAAEQVQSQDLARRSRVTRHRTGLASQVDAVAALTLLQRDLVRRINPAIVEAYLDRLNAARTLRRPGRLLPEKGFRQLSRVLKGCQRASAVGQDAHVATSGEAVREATTIDLGGLVTLGPGEPAFTDLIAVADSELAENCSAPEPHEDPTRLTPYDLYAFRGQMTESDGKRPASGQPWSRWTTMEAMHALSAGRPSRT